jgi:hypothetical protein
VSNPERIHNLTLELNATRTALEAEKARNRSLTDDLLRTAEPNRVLALAGSLGRYSDTKTPRLLKLLSVCEMVVLAADPLRSAPMSDTSRVGHPEDTAVESAYESKKRERANLVWVGQEMEHMIDRIMGRVAPDEVAAKERVERPRCWKRPCRGERGPINARYCPKCGKGYEVEDVEEVA